MLAGTDGTSTDGIADALVPAHAEAANAATAARPRMERRMDIGREADRPNAQRLE